jgi:hypothetical protein
MTAGAPTVLGVLRFASCGRFQSARRVHRGNQITGHIRKPEVWGTKKLVLSSVYLSFFNR